MGTPEQPTWLKLLSLSSNLSMRPGSRPSSPSTTTTASSTPSTLPSPHVRSSRVSSTPTSAPRARLLAHWPRLQRRLPLHGLAAHRAPPPDRDRARDEALPRRDQEAEPAPRRPLRPHDPQRVPRRELW